MRNEIKLIYKNFLARPDIWFFYGFLATFTLSIRKVLFFYPIDGQFNEYAGVYIYLSDIFLILTFLSWIISLCNEFSILSISKTTLSETYKMFHVEHSQIKTTLPNVPRPPRVDERTSPRVEAGGTFLIIKKTYTELIHNFTIYFPLIAVFFSFLSILWATNESIALFRSLKLLEFSLLFYYIIYNVPRGTSSKNNPTHSIPASRNVPRGTSSSWCDIALNIKRFIKITQKLLREMFHVEHFLKNILFIVIATSVTQSIIGLLQAFFQHSIDLYWLRESFISQNTPGVAKIILHGDQFVRAYGLFPHPNILGGFLVFSIFCTLTYFKMFHVEHFISEKNSSTSNQFGTMFHARLASMSGLIRESRRVEHPTQNKKIFKQAIISIQILALLLTFSKSAIIGLLLGFVFMFYTRLRSNHSVITPQNVPRGTFLDKIKQMFHVEHLLKKTFLITAIFTLLIIVLKPDLNSIFIKSLNERELFLNVSRETFLNNPMIGIGAGQFIINMVQYYNLEPWQYQPVHNVFLVILNEFGTFFLLAFLYFLYKLLKAPKYHLEFVSESAKQNSDTANIYFRAILISFIFIMLFDHYFWDIQQGQLILWLIFGFVARNYYKQSATERA